VRLRDEALPSRLWVDAVCINQADKDEKAVQIPKMRDIYSQSERVLIWLGADEPDDEGSLQFAAFLERASYRDRTPIEKRYVWAFPNENVPDPLDGAWKRFFALFKRQWFGRLWIIQEVAMAKDPVVLCGRSSVRWDTLLKALDYTGLLGIQSRYNTTVNLNAVQSLQRYRKQHMAGTPSSLAKLLVRMRGSETTDPRDKIYGLWGIADPDNLAKLDISASHDITAEKLYRTVTMRAIRASGNLDILQGIHSHAGHSTRLKLPTWAPDWTQAGIIVPLRHQELGYPDDAVPEWQSQNCRATGDSRASPRLTPDGKALGLRGHCIGVMEEVSCTVRHDTTSLAGPYDFQHALQDWERVAGARSGMRYRNGDEEILDCYWQTLCAAVMPGGYDICREEFTRYDYVLQTVRSFSRPLEQARHLTSHPWLKALAMVSGISYHRFFRSASVMEDLGGFQGNNGAMFGRRMGRSDTDYICLVPEQTG
jgi:hypothetical protein